ncbi:hypothetical protein ACIOC2_01430 [Streptomyces sp. NPDC088337]|uniref:hypothetical protein n=1 Tax=unclassified Streptomyces TaxID=2593676 RepID=UPI003825A7D6
MGFLDRFLGSDRELAATKYTGRESASDRAARRRREGHRRNLTRTAREGQAWEDRDRRRFS